MTRTAAAGPAWSPRVNDSLRFVGLVDPAERGRTAGGVRYPGPDRDRTRARSSARRLVEDVDFSPCEAADIAPPRPDARVVRYATAAKGLAGSRFMPDQYA